MIVHCMPVLFQTIVFPRLGAAAVPFLNYKLQSLDLSAYCVPSFILFPLPNKRIVKESSHEVSSRFFAT